MRPQSKPKSRKSPLRAIHKLSDEVAGMDIELKTAKRQIYPLDGSKLSKKSQELCDMLIRTFIGTCPIIPAVSKNRPYEFATITVNYNIYSSQVIKPPNIALYFEVCSVHSNNASREVPNNPNDNFIRPRCWYYCAHYFVIVFFAVWATSKRKSHHITWLFYFWTLPKKKKTTFRFH